MHGDALIGAGGATDGNEAGAIETVSWVPAIGAFVVSGFDEASQVLRGTGWSSDPRHSPYTPPQSGALPPGLMLFLDPPDHTRLRHLISNAFTPRTIARLRPRVAAVVDAVLDGLEGEDQIDVVGDIGHLVPLAIISELLDVGVEGAQLLQEQTPGLVRLLEVDTTADDLIESAKAAAELAFFLTPLLAERRRDAGEDFISALLAAGDDEGGLAMEEILATCILLLAAGHETTANLVSNATLVLLRHPGQRPHLFADPDRAVEELLRLEGPVKLAARVALTDQELAGHRIAAGRQVFLDLHQTGRDPRRWPDAERLDLSREPLPHLALGSGPHYCLGASLARLEVKETLVRLFTRFPQLRLVPGPVHHRKSTTFHGLTELLVRPHQG